MLGGSLANQSGHLAVYWNWMWTERHNVDSRARDTTFCHPSRQILCGDDLGTLLEICVDDQCSGGLALTGTGAHDLQSCDPLLSGAGVDEDNDRHIGDHHSIYRGFVLSLPVQSLSLDEGLQMKVRMAHLEFAM